MFTYCQQEWPTFVSDGQALPSHLQSYKQAGEGDSVSMVTKNIYSSPVTSQKTQETLDGVL